MVLTAALALACQQVCSARSLVILQAVSLFALQASDQFLNGKNSVFDILSALVFGFSSLNVLGLISRRLDARHRGLNFGELMAIAVVILAVCFLGWEMLSLFHILPIKLHTTIVPRGQHINAHLFPWTFFQ
jgi:hypothetical protein